MSERTMLKRPWKPWLAVGLLCLTPSLSACARSTKGTDVSCLVFEPITYSSRDTPETVGQVEAHNVRWERLCAKE